MQKSCSAKLLTSMETMLILAQKEHSGKINIGYYISLLALLMGRSQHVAGHGPVFYAISVDVIAVCTTGSPDLLASASHSAARLVTVTTNHPKAVREHVRGVGSPWMRCTSIALRSGKMPDLSPIAVTAGFLPRKQKSESVTQAPVHCP